MAEQGVKKLNDQMEQVQDEKAKLSQVLAELEDSTDEISQRDVAQQEQLLFQSYWWFLL